jgi:hypothetical protein
VDLSRYLWDLMSDSKFEDEKVKNKRKQIGIQKTHLLDRKFVYFIHELKQHIAEADFDGSPADITEVVYRLYNEEANLLKRRKFKKLKNQMINM